MSHNRSEEINRLQRVTTLAQINRNPSVSARRLLTTEFNAEELGRVGLLLDRGIESRKLGDFLDFISSGEDPGNLPGGAAPTGDVLGRTARKLISTSFRARIGGRFDPSVAIRDPQNATAAQKSAVVGLVGSIRSSVQTAVESFINGGDPEAAAGVIQPQAAQPKIENFSAIQKPSAPAQIIGLGGTSSKQGSPMATATPDTLTAPQARDQLRQGAQASPLAGPRPPQTSSDLFDLVAGAQGDSIRNQQRALGRAPAGREAIIAASPQLGRLSETLLQQAQDPGGGGFREDFQERIRVQQAARGLSGGTSAAFQEAALTSGALTQRRQAAGGQLQRLGGSFLQQLGVGAPIVADLAGIGQTRIAGQALSSLQAAGEEQSRISQDLFSQLSGFLRSSSFGPDSTGAGLSGSAGFATPIGTAGSGITGGIKSIVSRGI